MKRLSLFAIATLFVSLASQARVLTVSPNSGTNPNPRPAMYSDLRAAVVEANLNMDKDTIMLQAGKHVPSSNIGVITPIVFIGEGSSNYSTTNASFTDIEQRDIFIYESNGMRPDESKFIGIAFSNGTVVSLDHGVNDIEFKRCSFEWIVEFKNNLSPGTSERYNNIDFNQCRFYRSSSSMRLEFETTNVNRYDASAVDDAISFTCCVFDGFNQSNSTVLIVGPSNGQCFNKVKIANSTFIRCEATDRSAIEVNGMNVYDCLFYKSNPTFVSSTGVLSKCIGCQFNSNLEVASDQVEGRARLSLKDAIATIPANTDPTGQAITHDGNNEYLSSTSPNYPIFKDDGSKTAYLSGAWSINHSFLIDDALTIPLQNTVGLNCGSNIQVHPDIPVITNLSIPNSVIPQGGSLQIQIQAETRD